MLSDLLQEGGAFSASAAPPQQSKIISSLLLDLRNDLTNGTRL